MLGGSRVAAQLEASQEGLSSKKLCHRIQAFFFSEVKRKAVYVSHVCPSVCGSISDLTNEMKLFNSIQGFTLRVVR
jgi:hypothetical protein